MDNLNISQLELLQSKDQAALLDIVDELRNHGVSRYISLPQLIVCGDQSSGKSSVLEAISGVHFPVDDGLCTRFTTEVILRRAPEKFASVKLVPAPDASREHKDLLSKFKKPSVGHGEIPTLISEAKSIMGLTGNSTFSRDVLQLEISGPKLPHLTLVDLPGLIHHPNKEQTEEDVEIPKDLVRKYMEQPRSIILAIVTAKNDPSNQIVLEFAKKTAVRTMGIITKPDCLVKGSPNEFSFFELANNREATFGLGWHVLRNGDYNERNDPNFNRDEVEREFFASTPWKGLPQSQVGISSLRKRLSRILFEQIRTELPDLVEEIQNQVQACKVTMERLGPPRDSSTSRRFYLTSLAERFQSFVRAGIAGDYQDPFFQVQDQTLRTRIRAKLRNLESDFAETMYKRGHTYEILTRNKVLPTIAIGENGPIVKSWETFIKETRELLNQSKGRELPGTYSPLLVGELFTRQSKKWRSIAMTFVSNAWQAVKQFLDDVLDHVADDTVRQAILQDLIDPAMELKLQALKDKVDELMTPYSNGYPSTLNRRFVAEISRLRDEQSKGDGSVSLKSDDMDDHACLELLDTMQAYYTVALDVFVDNVAALAIENCLLRGLTDLLSPLKVSQMTDKELEAIASESDDIQEYRKQTVEKQTALEKSLDVCRRQQRMIASARLNAKSAASKSTKDEPSDSGPASRPSNNSSRSASIFSDSKSSGTSSNRANPTSTGSGLLSFPGGSSTVKSNLFSKSTIEEQRSATGLFNSTPTNSASANGSFGGGLFSSAPSDSANLASVNGSFASRALGPSGFGSLGSTTTNNSPSSKSERTASGLFHNSFSGPGRVSPAPSASSQTSKSFFGAPSQGSDNVRY